MGKRHKWLSLLLAGFFWLWVPGAQAVDVPSLNNAIQQKLSEVLTDQFPEARAEFGEVKVHAAVRDKQCDAYELVLSRISWRNNIPVQVRCLAPTWSFYVSVPSRVKLPALSPTRLIQRNEPLHATDFEKTWFDAAQLRQGIISDHIQLEQRTPRTNLRPGQAVYAHQLTLRSLINKGDQVVIRAVIGSAGVSSAGIALASGKLGEQIRVRNANSGRTIKVYVWQEGVVGSRPRPQSLAQTRSADQSMIAATAAPNP